MRYVIIRDDDTNALTPVSCLERLYRPFLDRGLPVNLATIPLVDTATRVPDGTREGFLLKASDTSPAYLPIGSNTELVGYLRRHPGFHIAQHGLTHAYLEFDRLTHAEAVERLDRGARFLAEAGLGQPVTFVAPYDKISRGAYRALVERFRVVSTGWFELNRLPAQWWARYMFKKIKRAPHWRVGETWLLSHPGCLLSCHRDLDRMFTSITDHIQSHTLSVLVTHWWEYFRNNQENKPFLQVLHAVANYLAAQPDIRVLTFAELTSSRLVATSSDADHPHDSVSGARSPEAIPNPH